MAIELPNNKISRTLPEQVGFNSTKIAEIIKWINDSELKDKVIDLEAGSGVLTDEQYAIAEISPSYIVYNGNVFIKAVEDSTYIDFIEAGVIMSESTSIVAKVKRIRITIATKAYAYSEVSLFETYNKTQIESFVATEIAVKADLAGANFTGPITAPSIIEDMSGYSYVPPTNTTLLTTEIIYAGIVKNGNKLTLTIFFKQTLSSTSSASTTIGKFNIPSAVADKLFPYNLSGVDVLANGKISLWSSLSSVKDQICYIQKGTNALTPWYSLAGLSAEVEYVGRYEQTFLLSDNMAS